jgi:hypothetical protein
VIVKLWPAVMTRPAVGFEMGFDDESAAELGYFCVRDVTVTVDICK